MPKTLEISVTISVHEIDGYKRSVIAEERKTRTKRYPDIAAFIQDFIDLVSMTEESVGPEVRSVLRGSAAESTIGDFVDDDQPDND